LFVKFKYTAQHRIINLFLKILKNLGLRLFWSFWKFPENPRTGGYDQSELRQVRELAPNPTLGIRLGSEVDTHGYKTESNTWFWSITTVIKNQIPRYYT
jgi:hypothetical protein